MRRRYSRAKLYGCDSKWELKLREGILKDLKFHPCKLHYTKPSTNHTYEPDWVYLDNSGFTYYIEAKGRFVDRAEYTKYIHVRESLGSSEELVFLFMKPNTPMPGARRRKDGTIRTHTEWAEKEGFRWFSEQNINLLIGDKE
jgi:predicted glutamine amidotransferase